MLTTQEIRQLIDNDEASEKKRLARQGQRYYEAEHDIKNRRIFFVNADGKLEEDKLKSNIKISHPFFTELVDQAVQYMLSGEEGFIRSDDPKLQEQLDAYFNENEDFISELYEVLTGCMAKGFEYGYIYKDENNKLIFQCADSLGVVEVRENSTDEKCKYLINSYIDYIDNGCKAIKRIEVWDESQTYFYCQIDDGDIMLDEAQKLNPRPHTLYQKGKKTLYDSFGFIPFFRLDNCKKQFSGLKHIKDLIDDYDLMNVEVSNALQDTVEAIYAVEGFDGDNLDELMLNLKAKKTIGMPEGGKLDVKTIDVPVEARKAKMDIDKENIYHFGFGVDTAGLRDTAATVSVAIKSAYSLLDLKCNKLEIRLKQFLRKLLNVVLDEINKEHGTAYAQKDVYFKFDRIIPVNEQENAQVELIDAQRRQAEINTLLSLATHLDNETLMQLICEQLDIDYEDIKDKLPEPVEADPYAVIPEEEAPEEGVLIE